MHETRKHILDVLDKLGIATVDQIVSEMEQQTARKISAVTVRYHLGILQEEGSVSEPTHLERTSRGRPQHVFSLSPRPYEPQKNYAEILLKLFQAGANVNNPQLMAEIGVQIAQNAADLRALPLSERFGAVVEFLNKRGYSASWEATPRGIILTTGDCPYHDISQQTDHLCTMDMGMIGNLVGAQPQRLTRIAGGDTVCSYWFDTVALE